MKNQALERLQHIIGIASVLALLVGCSAPTATPTSAPLITAATLTPPVTTSTPSLVAPPTATPAEQGRIFGLSDQDVATLGSLKKVDDYPLYTMRYYGSYNQRTFSSDNTQRLENASLKELDVAWPCTWACSLFAALGDAGDRLYGRSFDWEYSPAVLLFADPPDGYASVSMVDISYLGFNRTRAGTLADVPVAERLALIGAPFLPFDGMNERGLAVGMAAVPPGNMRPDPSKESVGSLGVIRKILDQAGNVDEAVAILQRYNISVSGGPPLHYLIADSSGRAALVEFYQGKMHVIPNEKPWHQATNFLRSAVSGDAEGQCWRYDTIIQRLAQAQGRLDTKGAMTLLADVSQNNTQWSIVYKMSTGDVSVAMGRQYTATYAFHLDLVSK